MKHFFSRTYITRLITTATLFLILVLSGVPVHGQTTYYYSYQSGSWNNATTWTTDPSGTLSINPGVPGANDMVIILNGRAVTATASGYAVMSLQINEGGTLDLAATTGHNFGEITGRGLLRLSTMTFPGGNYISFTGTGGGTVEYYNVSGTLGQGVYNNLQLRKTDNTPTIYTITLGSNLVVNHNLDIARIAGSGTMTFHIGNNNTSRTINIEGNFTIGEGCNITTRNANAIHTLNLGGDFTNNGSVRFTNQAVPNFTGGTNTGAVNIVFEKLNNSHIQCNGPTDFFRVIINKGNDDTYQVSIEASDPDHFRLFGRRDYNNDTNNNRQALSLRRGTARIGPNIDIQLADGGGNNFIIQPGSRLHVDGGRVFIPSIGNQLGVTGTFLLTDGVADCEGTGGIHLNNIGGTIIIEGGTLNARILRSSVSSGDQLGTYNQSGGTVVLSGPMPTNNFGRLSWFRPENRFIMSGGTLIVRNSGNNNEGIDIRSLPENISISGGIVIAEINDGRNFKINTRAPFWTFLMIRTGGASGNFILENYTSGQGSSIGQQPLVVLDDLRMGIDQGSSPVTLTTNNSDVTVGGDFIVGTGSVFTPGNNTTTLDGSGTQLFNVAGSIGGGLNNLTIGSGAEVTFDGLANFAVNGNLITGESSIVRDNGRVITVNGNITHSGTHFKPAAGAGSIQLTGAGAQVISGNGEGSFNNFTINKPGGSVTMSAKMAITGNLRLASAHRLNIGSNRLTLGPDARVFSALTGTDQLFSATKMIVSQGLASDGGIKKEFSATGNFLFPIGFRAIDNNHYYMPAHIGISQAPATWGSITLRPVNERHHLAQGEDNALICWWKTTAENFTGVATGSVTHRYFYDHAASGYFVRGNEAAYIPAVYRSGTNWVTIPDVNQVNQGINEISFNSQSAITGEYSAGEAAAFSAVPILYSRQNGPWNDPASWSAVSVGGPSGSTVPGPGTLVIIGDISNDHTITITADNIETGALFIASGSVLDMGTTRGHNFASIPEESVTGAGTIRISASNYFPRGDFGEFIGPEGGTVEYYSSAGAITIPQVADGGLVLDQYRNLVLNNQGSTITLPESNLTIYENLIVKGTSSFSRTSSGTGWNSLTVNGDLIISSTEFTIMDAGGTTATITVNGDLIIDETAIFQTRNSGSAFNHILELHGNLVNNGTFNMHNGTRRAMAIFRGLGNTSISGSGTTFNFHNITVDKGTGPGAVLSLESEITTGVTNPFLTLVNGTFRIDNPSLTVTLTGGTTNFTIPATAALSVNTGEARVAWGTSGSAHLLLAGTLEVLGGSMFIGNPATNTNNSIEYASVGRPVIRITGGELNVNGQIRRATTTSSGSLNYIQSGGTTTVSGKVRVANRGLIEIVNEGSFLGMSGGSLTFGRPSTAGTTFGDIYLRPGTHQVTGGTLQAGTPASTQGYNFTLSTSAPLWNVVAGTPERGQILTNNVLPVTILNDLTINANSRFQASGLDVTIGRNFVNNNNDASPGIDQGGFRAGSSSQTTTFNGSNNQQIAGSGTNLTNFANLVLNSSATLHFAENSSIRVNGNLNLSSGTLNDGGNTIAVTGNIINTSIHTSQTASGGLRMAGTDNQTMSGIDGTFGNIILDNSTGVSLMDNTTINGRLTFNSGSIYIDDYLLTFGQNASIGGVPGNTRMIILNGTLSDLGVRRLFPAGASEFTIPFGVQGKYTPATYNVSASTAPGSITVRPVNRRHPAVTDAAETELAYYWKVDSTGFGHPLSISHTYSYDPEDVKPSTVSDTDYVAGLYRVTDYSWVDLGDIGNPGMVDESGSSITITNAGFIAGAFTAGRPDNFTPGINIYYSRNDRTTDNWSDPQAWSVLSHAGPPAATAPDGPVIIAEGHTIILDQDGLHSTSVEINGTLDCSSTVFHNLGTVFGTGKIIVESTTHGFFVFPGGSFDEFFETPGTTVEFTGSNTASLPLKPGNIYKPYYNVIISGSGRKNISADNMKVLGNLIIENGTTLSNLVHNKNIHLSGNWINNNTSPGTFIAGTGTVFFEGSDPQGIILNTTERFYDLVMDNLQGVDLTGSAGIEITRRLTLSSGHIFSHTGKEVTLLNTSPTQAVIGGSASSFVDGPLRKRIFSGQSFNFPTGNDGRLGRITLLNTSASPSPSMWTARYVNNDPAAAGHFNAVSNLNEPLTAVSNNEYWEVNRPAGGSANLRLRWDGTSFPAVTVDPNLRPLLRVAQYETTSAKWTQRGQSVTGTTISGTVSTTTPVTQPDYIFTLGVIGVSASIADLTPVSICDNDEIATIPVNLTGTAPWTLTYRISGGTTTEFTETNIMSSPFNIQLRGSDIGGAAGSPYILSLVSVSQGSNPGTVNENTLPITIRLTNRPSIAGPPSVGVNQTRLYSTTLNTGNNYTWAWNGSNGGTIATPGSHSTNIVFNNGTGTFQLTLVEETAATGCFAADAITIEVLDVPVPDITPKDANICTGTIETYSTQYNEGNEYRWTVTGGVCTQCGIWSTDASVQVEWSGTGNASVSVEERLTGTEITGIATQNYFIYPMPLPVTLSTPPVCPGTETIVVVENSQLNISYQLLLNTDNTPVGAPVPGTGGARNLSAGELPATTTFNVLSYNLGCELVSAPITATVHTQPTITFTLSGNNTFCDGEAAEFDIQYTSQTPDFTITINREKDGEPDEIYLLNNTDISGSPYQWLNYPVWDGVVLPPNNIYTYGTKIIDGNNCENLPVPAVNVSVWKQPETGPQYHIPNNFGQ
ncbi:MAG: beta strand repeat-containing protein [Bacteroidales bacterium]